MADARPKFLSLLGKSVRVLDPLDTPKDATGNESGKKPVSRPHGLSTVWENSSSFFSVFCDLDFTFSTSFPQIRYDGAKGLFSWRRSYRQNDEVITLTRAGHTHKKTVEDTVMTTFLFSSSGSKI